MRGNAASQYAVILRLFRQKSKKIHMDAAAIIRLPYDKSKAFPIVSFSPREPRGGLPQAASCLIILNKYYNAVMICISFFAFPVLCFPRPRETDNKTKTKRGVDHEEAVEAGKGVLRELFPPGRLIGHPSDNGKKTKGS